MGTVRSSNKVVERREFVAKLIKEIPDALIITSLGSPSYDVFAAGDRTKNFYLWGAMGGSTSMGLGLALAQPDKSVVVVTGDGEQLMGIGSLATIGAKQPANLTIVVLDNGHYGETGMQRSHLSLGTDLVAVAKGFGIHDAYVVDDLHHIDKVAAKVNARNGVALAQVYIDTNEPVRALPSRDGVHIKNRFRAELNLQPF
ncbi:aldehyde dehydrogenase [Advenella sp. WQ 585]|uniref:Aldehyde dehydrogenase n=2 Tax=Advenella mandrilli TaxID=2800330 RepID=A0ABS1EFY9_9BURK|nr:aldehyde dehydrogenase [Advenella mandrilli]